MVTFDNADVCPATGVPEIRAWLTALLASPGSLQPNADWTAFEQYTTRAMSQRLAEAFDRALARQGTQSVAARV